MRADQLYIEIQLDRDWVALNIYRMALEKIVADYDEDQWGFTGEDAADIARRILEEFPGSAKK